MGTPLTDAVREALPGWAVWVGNDATAACWAERERGAARGADEVLMVTLGTGIGGGIISNGRLFEGSNRYAGEFGDARTPGGFLRRQEADLDHVALDDVADRG